MKTTIVIVWWLTLTIPAPCPDSGPDQYGNYRQYSCLALHYTTTVERHEKTFDDMDEALEFLKNLPSNVMRCEVKIDKTFEPADASSMTNITTGAVEPVKGEGE